jgi:hypothetical protein
MDPGARDPPKTVSLSVSYPHTPVAWKKMAKYAGVTAIILVLVILIISVVGLSIVAGLLAEAAAGMQKVSAPLVCWRWLDARQDVYEAQNDPGTGQPYTRCAAANAAVADAGSGDLTTPCPEADAEDPLPEVYTYYASSQC